MLPKRGAELRPGALLCGCEIVQELGRGAFGAVYLAREPAARRHVAIKLLLDPHRKPHRLERFKREAHALGRLDHPGVVRVHRADLEGDMPCLVMEYVQGRGLDEVLEDDLPLDARLELLEQIARAVGAAHAAGVIHRDLKPANVLVTEDGQVKVTDFGLARDLDRETRLTETGTMLGTPSYMAPEQVRGGDVGAATDVWALGVLSYQMLTGERPFQGETVVELCHGIVNGDATRPSRVSRRLTSAHDRLCAAALQKDGGKRPSADELADLVAKVRSDPGMPSSRLPWILLTLGVLLLSASITLLAVSLSGGQPVTASASSSASATPTPSPTASAASPTPAPAPAPVAPPVRSGRHAELWREFDEAVARGEADAMVSAASTILQRLPGSISARVGVARGHDLAMGRKTRVMRGLGSVLREAEGRDLSSEDLDAVVRARLILAQFAFVQGKSSRCLAHLTAAVRLAPDRPTARTRRGLQLLFSGKKNDAASGCREDLEEAVRDGARDSEALRNLATLRWDDGRESHTVPARREQLYAEAESLYAGALTADPTDAEAHQLRAWMRRDQKRTDAMNADYDAALVLFRKGKDAAGSFYRAALRLRRRIDTSLERAEGGRAFNDALWAFDRTTGLNRRHPLANAYAGQLRVAYAASLLVRGSSNTHPQVTQAVTDAVSKLSWARSVNGRSWEAAAWLAEALALVSKPDRATKEAEAGLALVPDRHRPLALRAKAAALIANRRAEDALITLEIVLSARPRDWYASWLQCLALKALGRRAQAGASLQRAKAELRW